MSLSSLLIVLLLRLVDPETDTILVWWQLLLLLLLVSSELVPWRNSTCAFLLSKALWADCCHVNLFVHLWTTCWFRSLLICITSLYYYRLLTRRPYPMRSRSHSRTGIFSHNRFSDTHLLWCRVFVQMLCDITVEHWCFEPDLLLVLVWITSVWNFHVFSN